jgi:hypothetical protein
MMMTTMNVRRTHTILPLGGTSLYLGATSRHYTTPDPPAPASHLVSLAQSHCQQVASLPGLGTAVLQYFLKAEVSRFSKIGQYH